MTDPAVIASKPVGVDHVNRGRVSTIPVLREHGFNSDPAEGPGRRILGQEARLAAQLGSRRFEARVVRHLVQPEQPAHDGRARFWSAVTRQPIGLVLPHHGAVWVAAFSFDGKTVASGSVDGAGRLWEAATSEPIQAEFSLPAGVWSLAFSLDGKTVLTGSVDRTGRLWDIAGGKSVGSPFVIRGRVNRVALSPDGKTVRTEGLDGTARVWNAATRSASGAVMAHGRRVNGAEFSPDGKTIATVSDDRTAQLWDAITGNALGVELCDAPRSHSRRTLSEHSPVEGDRSGTRAGSGDPHPTNGLRGRARTSNRFRRVRPPSPPLQRGGTLAQACVEERGQIIGFAESAPPPEGGTLAQACVEEPMTNNRLRRVRPPWRPLYKAAKGLEVVRT